jgi:hypothetical protein
MPLPPGPLSARELSLKIESGALVVSRDVHAGWLDRNWSASLAVPNSARFAPLSHCCMPAKECYGEASTTLGCQNEATCNMAS